MRTRPVVARTRPPTGQELLAVSPEPSQLGWLKLTAIAAVLLVAGLATYVYNGARLDAEQRASGIALAGGNPDRAPALIVRYGCAGCHQIRGVPEASGMVGPDLNDVARRPFIGGVVEHTAQNLVDWIVDPHQFDEKSAMPRTGITEEEARDVAAYLYSLR